MSIHVICGPMFAGKTTFLLESVSTCEDEYIVLKHSIDDRYSEGNVVSHDGISKKAIATKSLLDVDCGLDPGSHVFIDEGQFFSDLRDGCLRFRKLGYHVTVATLDLAYNRKWFKPVLELLEITDSMKRIYANCDNCEEQAPFTHRKKVIDDDDTFIVVGGSELYVPMCESCWNRFTCA